jgi:Fe2+ transport system protein FeoA
MYPLSMCKPGEKVLVKAIGGGLGFRQRLQSMGFFPGEEVEVVSAHGGRGGPVIVNVKGSRLGIGFGMAQKILVYPIKQQQLKSNC